MDPVTLGMAKAATKRELDAVTLSAFSTLRSKLDRGIENVALAVLGDSTGAGNGTPAGQPTRWVWPFVQKLAAAYPQYTVNFRPWNATSNAYDATVVVQTGTGTGNSGGPFVLDIYNGSASGKTPFYTRQNVLGMLPGGVRPDLVIFNHGHNMTEAADDATIAAYYQMVRDVRRFVYAGAAIAFMGQNPRTAPATGVDTHFARMARIRELAATEGVGFIDTTRQFLSRAGWETSLMTADGIHPNTAGSQLQADYMWSLYQRSDTAQPMSQMAAAEDYVWIPGQSMLPSTVVGGAPSAAVIGSTVPGMSFAKASDTIAAVSTVHIPTGWRRMNVWLYFSVPTATTGNVAWRLRTGYIPRVGVDYGSGASGTALALSGGTTSPAAVPTGALAQAHHLIMENTAFTGSRNVLLEVQRQASNAADTCPEAAHLFGVMIERAG